MSNNIYMKKQNISKIPEDFVSVFDKYNTVEYETIKEVKKHYNAKTPSTIISWMKRSGLKETIFFDPPIDEFKKFFVANRYSISITAKHYGIQNFHVSKYVKRNGLNGNYVPSHFNPNIKDFNNIFKNCTSYTELADYYKVTPAMISSYMQRNGIEVEPYWGTKVKIDIEELKKDSASNIYTRAELLKKYNISYAVLNRLVKQNDLVLPKCFLDDFNDAYQNVLINLDRYVELNKKDSIWSIAISEGVSHYHIKRAFKENSIPVVIHSINKSKGELQVKEFIQSLGFECISSKKIFKGKRLEIDCFVPELNFGVEYCGEYWHQFDGSNKNYHQDKYNWCKDQGIQLMTIFEHEWFQKQDIIKSMIKNKLGLSIKIFGRKTVGKPISSLEAKKFHECNHVQGYVNSSLNYGLYHDNILVSVLSLSKSRFDRTFEYEITRLSTLKNHIVVGGFSKLLKLSEVTSLMTYADLRFGSGDVYLNNGFKKCKNTPPNYWYFNRKDDDAVLESRMKYQKKKLINMKGYSIDKTELSIMNENNYIRIYDCGSNKYSLVV